MDPTRRTGSRALDLQPSVPARSGALCRARWAALGALLPILLICALVWLWAGSSPAMAQGTVTVRKLASTGDNGDTAFNGDTIAYTIIVNNDTANTLRDILILDVLPENVLDNVVCLDANNAVPCELINETEEIPEPLGGTLTVTTTRQISWQVPSIAPNSSLQRSFTARVIGQADGAAFTNVAYVSYREQSLLKTQASNEVRLNVRLRIEQGGTTTLSDTPTWFSEDVGGTLSSDWADFDGDGDLDMVLGSTLGTTVYRNSAGQMEQFWTIDRPAYGVRWADVNGDGVPELIAVGAVEGEGTVPGNQAQLPGLNYIYRYDSATGATTRRFVELSSFRSTVQMVRVEAADFDNDGAVDLIASTNAINPDCPVALFTNDGAGTFTGPGTCISRAATAALKPVDFDNDGDLDLVMGLFPNRVQILVNEDGNFTTQRTVSIEEGVMFLPYDFAWGDFDRDGYLDLAAAYPLMREVRIYRNLTGSNPAGAFARPISLRTNVFLTPYALDWGDFSGDGKLDLAVADSPPIIYSYSSGFTSSSFQPFFVLTDNVVRGQVWSLRAIDQNNDGDIDLALTDRDGPSLVISNFRPPLNTTLNPVQGVAPFGSSSPASSVAWIDADGDDDLDLLFGAGPSTAGAAALNTKLYYNEEGSFPPEAARAYSGFGPHAVAVGDADGDRDLDIAIGSTSEQRLHRAGEFLAPHWSRVQGGEKALAWGDADGDVDLDLLVATTTDTFGRVELFLNDGTGNLGSAPAWSAEIMGVRAIAWGDMDGDGFADIAIGREGTNLIYRNNRDTTFSLFWSATEEYHTRDVAWGDYDGDGDLDLAVGNFGVLGGAGEVNLLYENVDSPLGRTFVARTALGTETFHTTSLDWGDWDNDGDLDLAVGNYGEKDQIYVNSNSAPGLPQFFWLWSSSESLNTTGVAWGDKDNDGDLDLAISQDGNGLNGIYDNNIVVPSHLPNSGFGVATLINPPLYVHLGRPGSTASAYDFSSAELLSGPNVGPISIPFRIYNPTNVPAVRTTALTEASLAVEYQYSLDGGGVWKTATPITVTLPPITDELGSGIQGTFIWDALRDQAIGDNARFRVRVVQAGGSGPVQRVAAAASSPPFRVRAITCIWPEQPEVRPLPVLAAGGQGDGFDFHVAQDTVVNFTGKVAAGTGALYYTWDFGNGVTASGQSAEQQFRNGTYTVRMAVRGEPCPQTRERAVTLRLKVGTGSPDLMLPLIRTASITPTTPITPADGRVAVSALPDAPLPEVREPLPQVEGLTGDLQVGNGALWLRWSSYAGSATALRLYRSERDADPLAATRVLVAELPPDATGYQENTPLCDHAYVLVAVAGDGSEARESLPSTSTYYTPSCATDGVLR
ncbi:MAG: VCBS repeat-containing protein [Caldilineaceae bacterium]|nr:VCBS repeat-containing protein [Caldilineaceae bacterium]